MFALALAEDAQDAVAVVLGQVLNVAGESGARNPKPFVWTKTADQILEALATYCERITDSGR